MFFLFEEAVELISHTILLLASLLLGLVIVYTISKKMKTGKVLCKNHKKMKIKWINCTKRRTFDETGRPLF